MTICGLNMLLKHSHVEFVDAISASQFNFKFKSPKA